MISSLPLVQTLAVGVLAYVVYALGRRFMAAEGTMWERVVGAFKGSATIAVAYAEMIVAALPIALYALAEAIDDPGMQASLEALIPPDWKPVITFGFAFAVYWARKRTL